MRCEEIQERLQLGGAAAREASVAQHLAGCSACAALAERAHALDALLDADADVEPRSGFDQRFFERLEAVKAPAWWRRPLVWLPTAALAAGLAVAVVWPRQPELSPEDLGLAMELEMLESFDVARSLEEVEAFELLAGVDPSKLRALLSEESTR